MCTLVIMRNVFPSYPLVVASNRDERLERPSATAKWISGSGARIYAPTDLVNGGTWIGVSEHGTFAALTNRDDVKNQSGRASRGQLVLDALRAPSAEAAVQRVITSLAGRFYNGFHLVLADEQNAFLCVGFGHQVDVQPLKDGGIFNGFHVITGYGTTRSHAPRAKEIEMRFGCVVTAGPTPAMLDLLLNFHANGDPQRAACVHDPNQTHKTVSSMLIRAVRGWSRFETWERNGFACSGPFNDMVAIPIIRKEHAS